MPLVRIDLMPGRSAEQISAIADSIQSTIVEIFGIPERDRFQVINELPVGRIIALDAGLGFERSAGVVIVQIFTQRGRDTAAKQRLYARLSENLSTLDVAGEDLFVSYIENGPEDWSFGFGEAQYVTGQLAVPRD